MAKVNMGYRHNNVFYHSVELLKEEGIDIYSEYVNREFTLIDSENNIVGEISDPLSLLFDRFEEQREKVIHNETALEKEQAYIEFLNK
jgi:hypothetical protein